MTDSPTDPTKDDSKVDYGAASEGFAEDEELFENDHIQTIQIDSQTSTTRVSILIERANGATERRAASIELRNLVESDLGDEVFDESTGELDYNALSEELQYRINALIDFSARGDLTDDCEYGDERESESDPLRRERGRD